MPDPLADLLRRDAARLRAPADLAERVLRRQMRHRRLRSVLLLFPAAAAGIVAALWLATPTAPIAPPMAFAPVAPVALPSRTFSNEADALAKDARSIGRFFVNCLPTSVAAR